jgi:PhnB protein
MLRDSDAKMVERITNAFLKMKKFDFAGNAEEAFGFYRSIFGGEFSSVVRFKDMPMAGVNIPKPAENKMMHIALPVGRNDILMASDALESLGRKLVPGNNVYISVHPDSKEEATRIFKALAAFGPPRSR